MVNSVLRLVFCAVALCLAGCSGDKGMSANGEMEVPVSLCSAEPGSICTWAGTGGPGWEGDGQPLLLSKFYWPMDITVTPAGDTYVMDWNNHRVRKVMADETLLTVIGSDFVGDGPYDESDQVAPGALGTTVLLNHPTQMIPLPNGTLLLTAWHNHKLRTYDPATGLVMVICGAAAGFEGDGDHAREALLSQPSQTVLGPDAGLYILDQRNQRIRRIAADGTISTVVGTGEPGFAGDGGLPLEAQLHLPAGSNPQPAGSLAFGPAGRLYISDSLNNRIRVVDFDNDRIDTFAGTGDRGFSGDGGSALSAAFDNPRDLLFTRDGRLLVADELNHRIRAIDLDTGIISTVAGNGMAGFSGDGGPAVSASLNRPAGIAEDAMGRLIIADTYNHRIRRVNP